MTRGPFGTQDTWRRQHSRHPHALAPLRELLGGFVQLRGALPDGRGRVPFRLRKETHTNAPPTRYLKRRHSPHQAHKGQENGVGSARAGHSAGGCPPPPGPGAVDATFSKPRTHRKTTSDHQATRTWKAHAPNNGYCLRGVTDTETSMLPVNPEAQCAFKDLMTHGVLQFALRIAFRCVLHRCNSQDIHC